MAGQRWRPAVAELLQAAVSTLKETGEGFALLPMSIRIDEGYEDAPNLLDGILDGLSDVQIVRTVETVERNPVNQPFVGKNRPKRLTVIMRPELDDDDDDEVTL